MKLSTGKTEAGSLRLTLRGDHLLLLHQILAEAAFGMQLPNFATQVGMPRSRARAIINDLEALIDARPRDADQLPIGNVQLTFPTSDARAVRNALELVMSDLGHEEFHTRTGFELEEGADLLEELNRVLLAPLHIEQRRHGAGSETQAATTS